MSGSISARIVILNIFTINVIQSISVRPPGVREFLVAAALIDYIRNVEYSGALWRAGATGWISIRDNTQTGLLGPHRR